MENIHESDSQKEQPSSEIISRLEYILIDDYLTGINTKADAAEDILNSRATTRQERQQIIDQLDAEWLYMKQRIAVWGTLLTPVAQHPSGVVEYQPKILNGDELQSSGFDILPFAAVYDDEVIIQQKVVYTFVVNDSRGAILREGFTGDFPDSTPDMARRRLEYHYPAETARVRELAEVAVDASMGAPILNFRDYSIDFLTYAKGHREYLNDMQTYLFELMRFDKQLPYLVTCELDEYDDGSDPSVVQIVARPMRIILNPEVRDPSVGPVRHIPLIELSVYDTDKNKPNVRLTVPLRELRRFVSIRDITTTDSQKERQ